MSLFEYLSQIGFWQTLGSQLLLTALTFALAAAVGFPMGVLAFRYHMLTPPLIGLVNLLQTLPAFALFGIFVVLGRTSSATSLLLAVLYTILPVIFGTEKGFRRIGRPPVDAALGMGMDRRQLFFRVTLPLLMPVLVYTIITALIGGLQMFDVPQVLTNGAGTPNRSSTTLIMYLNNFLKTSKNYGMAGAVSVIIFLITGLLSILVFKTLNKDEQ